MLALLYLDPFVGDWDALEYTVSALRGQPSTMALGRSLFIFYNRALFSVAHSLFHLSPQHAYLVFKYAVVVQGVLAVIAVWILTRDLTHSFYTATVASLLVTFSPVFVIYSGQVMTDVPALLLLTVALIVHLRGLRQQRIWLLLLGAALLGAGMNLRETVGFYLPWLIVAPFVFRWRASRRSALLVLLSLLVFFIFAAAPFLGWFLFDPPYRAAWYGWRESMRAEAAVHPITIHIMLPWLAFFLATSPLVLLTLPFAAMREWREHKLSPLLLLAIVGLFANLLLLLNYSTAIGWRYLSSGLPALVPLISHFLMQTLAKQLRTERAFIAATAAIILIAILLGAFLWPLRAGAMAIRASAKEYNRQLEPLPRDAVVIAGAQSVAVKYWRGLGAGEWEVIGPGSGWPGEQLPSVIENYLRNNRKVFLDTDPRWWQPCGWHVAEIRQLVGIETQFDFDRVAPTIYEITPMEYVNVDQPHLEKLLPENRPDEVKRCFSSE